MITFNITTENYADVYNEIVREVFETFMEANKKVSKKATDWLEYQRRIIFQGKGQNITLRATEDTLKSGVKIQLTYTKIKVGGYGTDILCQKIMLPLPVVVEK